VRRASRGLDPFLDWKIRIFFAGALLAAAGILLGHQVLVLLAIIVLLVGLFATTILGKRHEREAAEAEEDEGDGDPPGGPHPLA
jgi:Flp pilus assembly protein TadB